MQSLQRKILLSTQIGADNMFGWPGFKLYIVWKHICINCDEGKRSFTLFQMSTATWILLPILGYTPHFSNPVTFRVTVTLKFLTFWQFKQIHSAQAALPKHRAARFVCTLSQGYHGSVCLGTDSLKTNSAEALRDILENVTRGNKKNLRKWYLIYFNGQMYISKVIWVFATW